MIIALSDLLEEGLSFFSLGKIPSRKIKIISSQIERFSDLEKYSLDDFNKIKYGKDNKLLVIHSREHTAIKDFIKWSNDIGTQNLRDLYISLLVCQFIKTQIEAVVNLSIDKLHINPFLTKSLNLKSPTQLIEFCFSQAIERSIVTSMGSFIQRLLLSSSDTASNAKKSLHGKKVKWDILITHANGKKAYIELKSGPNDVDIGQLKGVYIPQIENIEKKGHKGYIGETYGKRTDMTGTHGFYKRYMKRHKKRTLIGRELWSYVTGKPNYHKKLLTLINNAAGCFLRQKSIMQIVSNQKSKVVRQFVRKYKNLDIFYTKVM